MCSTKFCVSHIIPDDGLFISSFTSRCATMETPIWMRCGYKIPGRQVCSLSLSCAAKGTTDEIDTTFDIRQRARKHQQESLLRKTWIASGYHVESSDRPKYRTSIDCIEGVSPSIPWHPPCLLCRYLRKASTHKISKSYRVRTSVSAYRYRLSSLITVSLDIHLIASKHVLKRWNRISCFWPQSWDNRTARGTKKAPHRKLLRVAQQQLWYCCKSLSLVAANDPWVPCVVRHTMRRIAEKKPDRMSQVH